MTIDALDVTAPCDGRFEQPVPQKAATASAVIKAIPVPCVLIVCQLPQIAMMSNDRADWREARRVEMQTEATVPRPLQVACSALGDSWFQTSLLHDANGKTSNGATSLAINPVRYILG